jgi:hypothetical protein
MNGKLSTMVLLSACIIITLSFFSYPHMKTGTSGTAQASTNTSTLTPPGWVNECVDCPKYFYLGNRNLALDANGRPHIAYGGDNLYYAWYDGVNWKKVTVDDSPGTGVRASLILDNSGNPHIVYQSEYSAVNYGMQLKYAVHDETGWHINDVVIQVSRYDNSFALDGNGFPHIIYTEDKNIIYVFWNGSSWIFENVDSGYYFGHISIVLDGNGYPHISYSYDLGGLSLSSDLKHAYKDTSGWHTEIVDASPGVGGWYTSIDLDSNGYPHISYYDDSDLKYAYSDIYGWHIEIVDSGGYTSIALDRNGFPNICYYSFSYSELRYAYRDVSGWHIEPLTSYGISPSLVLDNNGLPHISYFTQGLIYAKRIADLTWETQVVDYSSAGGISPSLVFDDNGYPHISYNANDNLTYAWRGNSGWDFQTPVSKHIGENTSLVLDDRMFPHITYSAFDGCSNYELYYSFWDGSIWHTETIEKNGWGGPNASLTLDSNGYPHIAYYNKDTDLIKYTYWDGEAWNPKIIDSCAGTSNPRISIVLDDNDKSNITYNCDRDLYFAHWDGIEWQIQVVDPDGGWASSLALDDLGYPHIAYAGANGDLKYTYWDGVVWNSEIIDSFAYAIYLLNLSMKLDITNKPHISYSDIDDWDLKYAYRDMGGWNIYTLDYEGRVGYYNSLALDQYGNPHIVYTDDSAQDLLYTHKIPVLQINYPNGSPGSYFTIGGNNFPTDDMVSVYVNNHTLGTVPTDSNGNITFILNTVVADEGYYNVNTSVTTSSSVRFTLNAYDPIRPLEGDGLIFEVPSGISYSVISFLPLVR